MHETPYRIWSNAGLPEINLAQLREGTTAHELILASSATASNLVGGHPDEDCRRAQICFGQPDPADLIGSESLRWIHLTSAGYTRYDREEIRAAMKARGCVISNSSSVYDEPCAEHVLAMILASARRLPLLWRDQSKKVWESQGHRAESRLLVGESVLIVGYGAIGRRLGELLAPLRMKITAVRRNPQGNEAIRTISVERIDEVLGEADHVVNILPASRETQHFFNAARFGRLKRGAFFYNIGRGDTVDQGALRDVLEGERIAGAYLDVTTPEPLPAGDALWNAPNCWITPHSAGGHATEFDRMVAHFVENLRRFEGGGKLLDVILG
jgi:phosphoglycerate dehydrogenase-like enzyme